MIVSSSGEQTVESGEGLRPLFFCCQFAAAIDWLSRSFPVIGLVRMDFYKNGVLNVVHLPKDEATKEHRRRVQEGWVLAFTVLT